MPSDPAAFPDDRLAFGPGDVDLTRSPLRASLDAETFVLGAFNPGFTRLPGGNLLMMVRVAEALTAPVDGASIAAIRWRGGETFGRDFYPLEDVDAADPRIFALRTQPSRTLGLTSLSWLLPVELDAEGARVRAIHYDKAIAPRASYQNLGIEDARISRIAGRYYMTACCVSAERHGTALYVSENGLDYALLGLVLDHQNKDMLYFEGLIDGRFWALTRPTGDAYFVEPPDSRFLPGPAIQIAASPDGLHWKPDDRAFIRPRRGTLAERRIGGGAPPVLTPEGWLILYHAVSGATEIGAYRTFWALADRDDPGRLLEQHDRTPLLEANLALTAQLGDSAYLSDIVFTTGMVDLGDHYLVASGENDLACRLTRIPKRSFF